MQLVPPDPSLCTFYRASAYNECRARYCFSSSIRLSVRLCPAVVAVTVTAKIRLRPAIQCAASERGSVELLPTDRADALNKLLWHFLVMSFL